MSQSVQKVKPHRYFHYQPRPVVTQTNQLETAEKKSDYECICENFNMLVPFDDCRL